MGASALHSHEQGKLGFEALVIASASVAIQALMPSKR